MNTYPEAVIPVTVNTYNGASQACFTSHECTMVRKTAIRRKAIGCPCCEPGSESNGGPFSLRRASGLSDADWAGLYDDEDDEAVTVHQVTSKQPTNDQHSRSGQNEELEEGAAQQKRALLTASSFLPSYSTAMSVAAVAAVAVLAYTYAQRRRS